jgi:hypothetical protein
MQAQNAREKFGMARFGEDISTKGAGYRSSSLIEVSLSVILVARKLTMQSYSISISMSQNRRQLAIHLFDLIHASSPCFFSTDLERVGFVTNDMIPSEDRGLGWPIFSLSKHAPL